MKLNTIIINLFLVVNVLNVLCLIYKLFFKDKITVKSKKIIAIIFIFSFIFGVIYFDTHYAVIDKKIYKNDVKFLSVYSLNSFEIKEINKCREIEELFITGTNEKSFSKLRNFHNLNRLLIMESDISNCENINKFDNLKDLSIFMTTIDFKGFNSDTVSSIVLDMSEIKNFKALSECKSLKSITISFATVCDNYIVEENGKYIMKDSSAFASFDYVEELRIFVDIEDISGIFEMDSLKELKVPENAVSEDNIKLLENKGISITYFEKH